MLDALAVSESVQVMLDPRALSEEKVTSEHCAREEEGRRFIIR